MTEHQHHPGRRPHSNSRGQRPFDHHRGSARAPQRSERRSTSRNEPRIPAEITPEDLAFGARVELKSLTKENADLVARHLAMVAILEDDDPELAHRHAMAAVAHAGRLGVVRETSGITAYRIGDYALALRELRTFRRITGSDEHAALIADCERGLGRSEQALEFGHSLDVTTLSKPARVELAIVLSGAQRDLGHLAEARHELEIPELDKDRAFSYSARLFEAYADVLHALHDPDASAWDRRAQVAANAWTKRSSSQSHTPGEDTVIDLGALLPDEDDRQSSSGGSRNRADTRRSQYHGRSDHHSAHSSHTDRFSSERRGGSRGRGGSSSDSREGEYPRNEHSDRTGHDSDRKNRYRSDRAGSWKRRSHEERPFGERSHGERSGSQRDRNDRGQGYSRSERSGHSEGQGNRTGRGAGSSWHRSSTRGGAQGHSNERWQGTEDRRRGHGGGSDHHGGRPQHRSGGRTQGRPQRRDGHRGHGDTHR